MYSKSRREVKKLVYHKCIVCIKIEFKTLDDMIIENKERGKKSVKKYLIRR